MDAIKRKSRRLERGITWRPHHDSHYVVADMLVSARHAVPLCILQRTLLAVEEHLTRSGAAVPYGLLTGQLCECSQTDQPYVLIDGSRECPSCHDGHELHARMAMQLSRHIVEAERSGHTVIGYYRGATKVVPRAPPSDVALLQSLFAQPWQAMLLREGGPHGGAGAFVRIERTRGRAYAVPFVELLSTAHRRRATGPPQSAVAWANYDPREAVTRPSALGEGAGPRIDAPTSVEPHGSGMHRRVVEVVRGLAARQRGASRPGASVPASAPSSGHRRAASDGVRDAAVPRQVVASADLRPQPGVLDAALEPWPPSGDTHPAPGGTTAWAIPAGSGMPASRPGMQRSPAMTFPAPPLPVDARGGLLAPPVAETRPATGCYGIALARAAPEPRTAPRLAPSTSDGPPSFDRRMPAPVREPRVAPEPMCADVAAGPRRDRPRVPTADVASPSLMSPAGSRVPHVEPTRPYASPPFAAPAPSLSTTVALVAERSSSSQRASVAVEEQDAHPLAEGRGGGATAVTESAASAARAAGVSAPTATGPDALPRPGLPILLPSEEPDEPGSRGESRPGMATIAVLLAIVAAASVWVL